MLAQFHGKSIWHYLMENLFGIISWEIYLVLFYEKSIWHYLMENLYGIISGLEDSSAVFHIWRFI